MRQRAGCSLTGTCPLLSRLPPLTGISGVFFKGTVAWTPIAGFATMYYGLQVPLWRLRHAASTSGGKPTPTTEADFDWTLNCAAGTTAALAASCPQWLALGPRAMLPFAAAGAVVSLWMPTLDRLEAFAGRAV